ncbi:MAG TPA: hypothetical protein VF250_03515 [Conexibacter sp.]
MSVPRCVLILFACVASACALGAPVAVAAPAAGRGVVLSAGGHTVRLVDKAHRVGDARVGSAKGLRRGDVVRVQRGRARVTGHRRRVAFLGRVVRGAVVRLGDGSTFKLAAGGRRFAPGQTLLITLATGKRGDVVKVKPVRAGTRIGSGDDDRGGPGESAECGEDQAYEDDACSSDPGVDDGALDVVDGTVTALAADGSSLTLAPDDGDGEESYPVEDPSLLDGIAVDDEVSVTLDEDGTAIDVELLDWSDEPDPGDDAGDEDF